MSQTIEKPTSTIGPGIGGDREETLPLWANKTCEGCVFNIRGCCRRAITNYGYVRVESAGQYRPACSFHQEVSCASENKEEAKATDDER